MDDNHQRQLLFGTTPHRRPAATTSNANGAGAIGGGSAVPSGRNMRETMESANEERVDNLRGHVGQMRHLALNIGDEVREQNDMLDSMASNFDDTGDSVKKTIASIKRLASNSGSFHLCMMMIFAFVFFFLIYLLIR